MSRVSLSRRTALVLASVLVNRSAAHLGPDYDRAVSELQAALKPSEKRTSARRSVKAAKGAKRAAAKEARAEVRAAVMARADGACEACGAALAIFNPEELDHMHGRARSESVESCWMLCRLCHRAKTDGYPLAAHWLLKFSNHATLYGYTAEAAKARARLEGIVSMREVAR